MTDFTADVIIKLLEEPTEHGYPIKKRITEEALGTEITKALRQANNPLTKQVLCDIAGDRFERSSVPTLILYLRDPSLGVRASSADALGKIGDVQAGPALLERFADAEVERDVLTTIASALGAVDYRPAIPLLTQALKDQEGTLRGCAAWGLGIICATEAEEALRAALARETEPLGSYNHARISEALEAVELAKAATTSMARKESIPILLAVLKRNRHGGANLTCAAWALGRLRAKEAVRPLEGLLAKYPKGFLAEHIRAALVEIPTEPHRTANK